MEKKKRGGKEGGGGKEEEIFSTVLERFNNKNLTKYNLKMSIMTTFIFMLAISLKVPLECTSGLHGL